MFGRFLTSIFWGMIADRYGRKPVIMFGTITVLVLLTTVTSVVFWRVYTFWGWKFLTPIRFLPLSLFHFCFLMMVIMMMQMVNYLRVIFNTLFGLSTKFWMAVCTRFLLGSLCGILGPIKVGLTMSLVLYRNKFQFV